MTNKYGFANYLVDEITVMGLGGAERTFSADAHGGPDEMQEAAAAECGRRVEAVLVSER